jgi:hypothetical protein
MKAKHLFEALALSLGLMLALLAGLQMAQATPAAANFFVKPDGNGDCSQGNPCGLQTALSLTVNSDSIYVAGGAYTGTGSAVITVTRSITLYGGWDGAASGPVVRNPISYPTTLDGEWARRVVCISGNITPTLDGFIIAHGNATGLLANCPSNPDGCGGGVFVSDAHPIIANNIITNNVAALTTTGNPTAAMGYGGGLYLLNANRAVISGNLVISNAASTAYEGSGGGLCLRGSAIGTQVQFNRVLSNAATTTTVYGEGGGIWGGPDDVLIKGNVVAGNQTNSAGTGRAASLFQYGGFAHYLGNLVQGNHGSAAVELWYSQARFEGNRVVDNATTAGVILEDRSGGGPTLVNNVVARSGSRTLSVYGYDESSILPATLLHNTLVGSGTGYGIYSQYAALYLTNTIVASTTWGITNTTPASSTILADYTLFWANTHDGIQGTNPLSGDPAFVNPVGGDYHLGPGSAAIDAGVPTTVTIDIDGELRPDCVFWDIGADEVQGSPCWRVRLPVVLRN